MNMSHEGTSSRPTCPKCGSKTIVPIMYGLPTEEAAEEAERGKIALGGCCISEDSPQWHCRDCEHEWGRLRDP